MGIPDLKDLLETAGLDWGGRTRLGRKAAADDSPRPSPEAPANVSSTSAPVSAASSPPSSAVKSEVASQCTSDSDSDGARNTESAATHPLSQPKLSPLDDKDDILCRALAELPTAQLPQPSKTLTGYSLFSYILSQVIDPPISEKSQQLALWKYMPAGDQDWYNVRVRALKPPRAPRAEAAQQEAEPRAAILTQPSSPTITGDVTASASPQPSAEQPTRVDGQADLGAPARSTAVHVGTGALPRKPLPQDIVVKRPVVINPVVDTPPPAPTPVAPALANSSPFDVDTVMKILQAMDPVTLVNRKPIGVFAQCYQRLGITDLGVVHRAWSKLTPSQKQDFDPSTNPAVMAAAAKVAKAPPIFASMSTQTSAPSVPPVQPKQTPAIPVASDVRVTIARPSLLPTSNLNAAVGQAKAPNGDVAPGAQASLSLEPALIHKLLTKAPSPVRTPTLTREPRPASRRDDDASSLSEGEVHSPVVSNAHRSRYGRRSGSRGRSPSRSRRSSSRDRRDARRYRDDYDYRRRSPEPRRREYSRSRSPSPLRYKRDRYEDRRRSPSPRVSHRQRSRSPEYRNSKRYDRRSSSRSSERRPPVRQEPEFTPAIPKFRPELRERSFSPRREKYLERARKLQDSTDSVATWNAPEARSIEDRQAAVLASFPPMPVQAPPYPAVIFNRPSLITVPSALQGHGHATLAVASAGTATKKITLQIGRSSLVK
jgi:hypothetical protein